MPGSVQLRTRCTGWVHT